MGEIRFPYGLTPEWSEDRHRECRGSRMSFDFKGAQLFYEEGQPEFLIDLSGLFQGRNTRFSFFEGSLYRVTATSPQEECDGAAAALFTGAGWIKSFYKRGRIQKGRHWKTTRCKHYMDEGATAFSRRTRTWEVEADSYWSDGEYQVTMTWTYLPTLRKLLKHRATKTLESTLDSAGKL